MQLCLLVSLSILVLLVHCHIAAARPASREELATIHGYWRGELPFPSRVVNVIAGHVEADALDHEHEHEPAPTHPNAAVQHIFDELSDIKAQVRELHEVGNENHGLLHLALFTIYYYAALAQELREADLMGAAAFQSKTGFKAEAQHRHEAREAAKRKLVDDILRRYYGDH